MLVLYANGQCTKKKIHFVLFRILYIVYNCIMVQDL